jgi:hypothetical protein
MEAPSGLLAAGLHPNDVSLSGELGTTKGAGRREADAAGKPYAQKQNGGPPQLTTIDCAASSKKSRLLVRNARNAYMASSITDSSST